MASLSNVVIETEKDIPLVNKVKDAEMNKMDGLVVQSLRENFELREHSSESLSCIVELVKNSFPDYDASSVHHCLVEAFPDLQAQQSNDKEEIYYLGISFINSQSEEERIITWLKNRFQEDQFGRVSTQTLIEIARKESGGFKTNSLGYFLRKAFPKIYMRRSDRLRWWCGICLPEQELTQEDKRINAWLHAASKWLRQNMFLKIGTKEQCSVVYAAIANYVGKESHHQYITAIKSVFPNIIRKTINRIDYYLGVSFSNNVTREAVAALYPMQRSKDPVERPIISEEERKVVTWLRKVLKLSLLHREKIYDISSMLTKMNGEHTTEKAALKQLRKAFPTVRYRKRGGIGYVIGVEILDPYKPKDFWLEKSVEWLQQVLMPASMDYFEKAATLLQYIKEGVQCHNRRKCIDLLRRAFPRVSIKKSHDGQLIYGVRLRTDKHVDFPVFDAEDFQGNFSEVNVSEVDDCDEESYTDVKFAVDSRQVVKLGDDTRQGSIEDHHDISNVTQQSNENSMSVLAETSRLEDKVDKLTSLVDAMREELRDLRNELNQSTRQKDALIVQLQQTLVLLTQQQYQRMLKPAEITGQDGFLIQNIQSLSTLNNDVSNNVQTVKQPLPSINNLKQF
ncbi:uncharacterized protein LOC100197387 isoform X3 [Hydra vulgaris]|uniref:Uncharacterized protein LOC100197387 isoform X3 n=1 Tax=Hydra vulgaris TaxID=6087 RepID=A0ABM4B6H7_HYDVU